MYKQITVSKDGSGMYRNIQTAVNSLSGEKTEILIAPGVYREKILIEQPGVTLRNAGEGEVVLVWNDGSDTLDETGKMLGTFRSYSFKVTGYEFQAIGITFQNDYGYGRGEGANCGQAVAAFIDCDRASFYGCRFFGSQDTLYTGRADGHSQYYKDCYILGDIDFIFGGGNVYFDHCTIESVDRNAEFTVEDVDGYFNGYLTAASTDLNTKYGYVFADCDLISQAAPATVYLGRPWRDYSATNFIRCNMGAHIHPAGWAKWTKSERHKTCRYAEYDNYGEGSQPERRADFCKYLTDAEAAELTIENVCGDWVKK